MKGITFVSFGETFTFYGEFCTPLQVYREFYHLSDSQVFEALKDSRLVCEPNDFRPLIAATKKRILERRERTRKFREMNRQFQGQLF